MAFSWNSRNRRSQSALSLCRDDTSWTFFVPRSSVNVPLFSSRADVTLTDVSSIVPLLKKNIAHNEAALADNGGSLVAKELQWASDEHLADVTQGGKFKYVLVSDCVYYEASIEPLCKTLTKLATEKGAEILLSYEDRSGSSEDKAKVQKAFFQAVEKEFDVYKYKTEDCHEDYACDEISVLKLTAKGDKA